MDRNNRHQLLQQIEQLRCRLPKGDLLYTAPRLLPVYGHRFENSPHFGGMLIHDRVVINTALSPQKRRFTVAHELVHYYLHHSAPHCQTTELEANIGAALLLVPPCQMTALKREYPRLYANNPAAFARLAARRFGVTPRVIKACLRHSFWRGGATGVKQRQIDILP